MTLAGGGSPAKHSRTPRVIAAWVRLILAFLLVVLAMTPLPDPDHLHVIRSIFSEAAYITLAMILVAVAVRRLEW